MIEKDLSNKWVSSRENFTIPHMFLVCGVIQKYVLFSRQIIVNDVLNRAKYCPSRAKGLKMASKSKFV